MGAAWDGQEMRSLVRPPSVFVYNEVVGWALHRGTIITGRQVNREAIGAYKNSPLQETVSRERLLSGVCRLNQGKGCG